MLNLVDKRLNFTSMETRWSVSFVTDLFTTLKIFRVWISWLNNTLTLPIELLEPQYFEDFPTAFDNCRIARGCFFGGSCWVWNWTADVLVNAAWFYPLCHAVIFIYILLKIAFDINATRSRKVNFLLIFAPDYYTLTQRIQWHLTWDQISTSCVV